MNFPNATQAGDLVTVTCSENFGLNLVSVAGQGAAWSAAAGPSAGGFKPAWLIFAGQVVSPDTRVAITGILGGLNCAAQEWSGVTPIIDASNAAATQSTSISVGITTTSPRDLVLAVAGNIAGARSTVSGAPWVALNSADIASLGADSMYRIAGRPGTYLAGDSWLGSNTSGAAIVAFQSMSPVLSQNRDTQATIGSN